MRRPKPDTILQNKIVKHLNQIKQANHEPCEMDLTSDGWERFEQWGHQRHNQALKASGKTQPFFGRLETHCLKFAMIISKADDPESETVDKNALDMAIKWADFSLNSYSKLVMEELAFTESDRELKRLEDLIKNAKKIPHRDVVNSTKWSNKKIAYHAEILRNMGKIRTDEGKRGGIIYLWLG